jgi:CRP/FNR family transcriptional regulator
MQAGYGMASNTNILNIIRQHSSQQSLPAARFLFQEGDALRDVYLLEKGLVKLTRSETNGQELIVDLRFAGNLIGATSALANESAPMTAITVTTCEPHRLPVHEFLRLTRNNESFLHELSEAVSRQRNEQIKLRAQQSMLDARPRLIMLLLRLAKEFGRERKGQLCLALPLAKQEIAGLLGITPQRLSVILREMKRDEVIGEEQGWIILQNLRVLRAEAAMGEEFDIWSQWVKGQAES